MHGQGNYNIQVGQDPYARPPAFQQHPATTAPPTSHYGPLPPPPPPQVIQHGNPSFRPGPGAVAYQHVMTSVLHHGRPSPAMSVGMSSAQSYIHHPRPPQISNQISHSYPTIEQQPLPWSQNMHQIPPPPPPLQGQTAYQLPSSQGHTLERVHPSHAPPPAPPPYSSSPNVLTSHPSGSSVIPMREHSCQQSMAPVLPPPPPLPPSPPRVPPLPPSSPSSDILSKKEVNQNWKGLPDGENLELECSPPGKPMDDRSVHVQVQLQHTESGTNVGSVDAEAAHSLTDSDMDMEG